MEPSLAEHLENTLPRNRTGRINKPARSRFRYYYPRQSSTSPGFFARALPDGVMAERTINEYLILTPLLMIREDKVLPHTKKFILTHKQSGARICGPVKRLTLLHIAAAINGLPIDWSKGRESVQRQALNLPSVFKMWFRELEQMGLKEFKNA